MYTQTLTHLQTHYKDKNTVPQVEIVFIPLSCGFAR